MKRYFLALIALQPLIRDTEAAAMDPQQRWILEATYRAMENGEVVLLKAPEVAFNSLTFTAGIPVEQVAGTNTAVFAATMADDYAKLIYKDPDEAPGTFSTNIQHALLANRLSWYFDFKGPSVQLNTACSSSTVALDLACSSLKRGQSSMVRDSLRSFAYKMET